MPHDYGNQQLECSDSRRRGIGRHGPEAFHENEEIQGHASRWEWPQMIGV